MAAIPPLEILLIEDNALDLALTTHTFGKAGLQNAVRVAHDGMDALGMIADQDRPPDLIVMDLNLPRISGLGFIERLRRSPRTQNVPVIVLSGCSDDPDLKAATDLGGCAHLDKPLHFGQFRDAVQTVGLRIIEPTPQNGRPESELVRIAATE